MLRLEESMHLILKMRMSKIANNLVGHIKVYSIDASELRAYPFNLYGLFIGTNLNKPAKKYDQIIVLYNRHQNDP